MKKLFALTFLFLLLALTSAPLFAAEVETPSEETQMEAPSNNPDYLSGLTSGTGLLIVGGAGAGITSYNIRNRRENEPRGGNNQGKKEKENDEAYM